MRNLRHLPRALASGARGLQPGVTARCSSVRVGMGKRRGGAWRAPARVRAGGAVSARTAHAGRSSRTVDCMPVPAARPWPTAARLARRRTRRLARSSRAKRPCTHFRMKYRRAGACSALAGECSAVAGGWWAGGFWISQTPNPHVLLAPPTALGCPWLWAVHNAHVAGVGRVLWRMTHGRDARYFNHAIHNFPAPGVPSIFLLPRRGNLQGGSEIVAIANSDPNPKNAVRRAALHQDQVPGLREPLHQARGHHVRRHDLPRHGPRQFARERPGPRLVRLRGPGVSTARWHGITPTAMRAGSLARGRPRRCGTSWSRPGRS